MLLRMGHEIYMFYHLTISKSWLIMNACAVYYTFVYIQMFVSQIVLAPHCDCAFVCLRACMHVIWCTAIALPWYCVVSHCMDYYELCWHQVMIILGTQAFQVLQGLKISLNWSTCRSQMKLYVNQLSIYFYVWPCFIIPSSHPDDRQNLNPSDLSKNGTYSSFLCIGSFLGLLLNIDPLDITWQPQINNSLSFNSKSHFNELWNRMKSSLNFTANSHLSVPNLHPSQP